MDNAAEYKSPRIGYPVTDFRFYLRHSNLAVLCEICPASHAFVVTGAFDPDREGAENLRNLRSLTHEFRANGYDYVYLKGMRDGVGGSPFAAHEEQVSAAALHRRRAPLPSVDARDAMGLLLLVFSPSSEGNGDTLRDLALAWARGEHPGYADLFLHRELLWKPSGEGAGLCLLRNTGAVVGEARPSTLGGLTAQCASLMHRRLHQSAPDAAFTGGQFFGVLHEPGFLRRIALQAWNGVFCADPDGTARL